MNEILQRTSMRLREKSWKAIFTAVMRASAAGPSGIKHRFQMAKAALHDWESGYLELKSACADQWPDGLIPLYPELADSNPVLHKLLHPPTFGFTLLKIYKSCKNKEKAKRILHEYFSRVLQYHYYIYENRDYAEDGLIQTCFPYESPQFSETSLHTTLRDEDQHNTSLVKDPLFNSLLVLSNDCLIKMAGILKRDVSQLLSWNELTIHSMNEQLWNPATGWYHTYDLTTGTQLPGNPITGATPLAAQIPDQQQAYLMCNKLRKLDLRARIFPNDLGSEAFCHWLVAEGCKNYRYKAMAKKIKQSTYQKTIRHHLSAVNQLNQGAENRKTREGFNSVFFRLN